MGVSPVGTLQLSGPRSDSNVIFIVSRFAIALGVAQELATPSKLRDYSTNSIEFARTLASRNGRAEAGVRGRYGVSFVALLSLSLSFCRVPISLTLGLAHLFATS